MLYWFGLGFHWEGGKEEQHAATTDSFGKRKGHLLSLSLSLHSYSALNEVGCLGLV